MCRGALDLVEPGALRADAGFWGSPRHARGLSLSQGQLSRMQELASLPLDSLRLVSKRELSTIHVQVGSSLERPGWCSC